MLYGIGTREQDCLLREGCTVRILSQLRHPLVLVVHGLHGRAASEPRVRATATALGLRLSPG
jgi:hypothetical protein